MNYRVEENESRAPVVMALPYLPLAEPVDFGGWWLGPIEKFAGPWQSAQFEVLARKFFNSFRDPSMNAITSPSLLVRASEGAVGAPPNPRERLALQHAIGLAAVHQNPFWTATTSWEGWRVATADNADLWIQPLDVEGGGVALGRGGRVMVTTGGLNLNRESFLVPPPLELHLPFALRLDGELLAATYSTLMNPPEGHTDTATALAVALRWLLKSWQNSASITWEDRLVYLKIATEALTGQDNTFKSAQCLNSIFEQAPRQEGGELGLDDLLWSPGEPTLIRHWRSGNQEKESHVSQFIHWCCAFGDARNAIVHGEDGAQLEYSESGSPYGGPFVEVADRVVREAICVLLGTAGFPALWRRGLSRASFHAFRQLTADSEDM